MAELVYSTTHTVYYNTREPVPISEVIGALQALEKLLKDVPKVVAGVTDTKIVRSEFFIEKIESGSLIETVVVKLFFKDEQEFEKFLDKIRENGVLRNTLVGVALGGLVAYGVYLAAGVNKTPAPNITANNNTIINIGAGEVNMTPDQFRAVVEAAVSDKKDLAKNSVKFIAPAKREAGSSVVISGSDAEPIEITPQTILEAPGKVEIPADKRLEDVRAVDVKIRASDLDSKKSGWAGLIEGRTERVKIELDPVVNEAELFGKTKVKADVTIIYTMAKNTKELKPSTIFIRKIY